MQIVQLVFSNDSICPTAKKLIRSSLISPRPNRSIFILMEKKQSVKEYTIFTPVKTLEIVMIKLLAKPKKVSTREKQIETELYDYFLS